MCMGIPEGRVRSMGGSHMGKESKLSKGWSLKSISGPIAKIFFLLGSN